MAKDRQGEVVRMETSEFLSRRSDIMSGAVVFAGTRVPVEALFDNLADGMSFDEFLEEFPTVSRDQVEGVLALASEDMKRRVA